MRINSRGIILVSVILLLVRNTSYYWEHTSQGTLVSILWFLGMAAFAIILLVQGCLVVTRSPFDRRRLLTIGMASALLILAYNYPIGNTLFDSLAGKDVLVAGREGTANCYTLLKLKQNRRFYIRISCWGIDRFEGRYELLHDTITFNYDEEDKLHGHNDVRFGIIKLDHTNNEHDGEAGRGEVFLYKADSFLAFDLTITKYSLTATR